MRHIACIAGLAMAATTLVTNRGEASGTPAMAVIEFFEADVLEATIDIVSALPGEQGNGLRIDVLESAGVGATPTVTGDIVNGYSIRVDNTAVTSYASIALSIDLIPAVSADLRLLSAGSFYEASVQQSQPMAVLAGGSDVCVPEPGAAVLATMLGALLGVKQRRKR
ncbi:MAG: hypothetical protein AAF589_02460 [Planctomycetota bacterium]